MSTTPRMTNVSTQQRLGQGRATTFGAVGAIAALAMGGLGADCVLAPDPEAPEPGVVQPVLTNPGEQAVPGERAARGPLVAFPHPLITEVLFAVPTAEVGDANRDGSRHATGDEFVELANPHDRPIELRGYMLGDASSFARDGSGSASENAFTFVFPTLTLQPGDRVVVFNGLEQRWTGPVGDQSLAPPGTHERFDHAYVLTAQAKSSYVGLANSSDLVLLRAPSGRIIHVIAWGQPNMPATDGAGPDGDPASSDRVVIERLVGGKNTSFTRARADAAMVRHDDLVGEPLSPGVWPNRDEPRPAPTSNDDHAHESAPASNQPAMPPKMR